jgi:hypothetical protein
MPPHRGAQQQQGLAWLNHHHNHGYGVSLAVYPGILKQLWLSLQMGKPAHTLSVEPATWRKQLDQEPWPALRPGEWIYLVTYRLAVGKAPLARSIPPIREGERGKMVLNLRGFRPMTVDWDFKHYHRGWRYWKASYGNEIELPAEALFSVESWLTAAEEASGLGDGLHGHAT